MRETEPTTDTTRHAGRSGWIFVVVCALVAGTAAGADAQQHQYGAVHQWWTIPDGGAWNIDTYMWPQMISDADYFAQQFVFQNNPNGDDGAYMGLQQQGDGSRNARFSIWNATGARVSGIAGAECEEYEHQGSGWTCTIPYVFSARRWYVLRVWLLNEDAHGRWWGAWIDDAADNEYHIGDIRAPVGTGLIGGTFSLNEYFGTAPGCGAPHLPPSSMYVYTPVLNAGGFRTAIAASGTGRCSEGRVKSLRESAPSRPPSCGSSSTATSISSSTRPLGT